ncbi:glycosyltransferase, partial [Planctomycetota bacterium]
MMLGVPVLSSDFACWRKYVEGEQSGMMVDPCSIKTISDVCDALLQDPHKLKKMSENGRIAVQNKYNWNHEVNELFKCYRELLEK